MIGPCAWFQIFINIISFWRNNKPYMASELCGAANQNYECLSFHLGNFPVNLSVCIVGTTLFLSHNAQEEWTRIKYC